MQMQMKDDLPPSPLHIDKKAISGICNPVSSGHVLGGHQEFGQDGPIGIGEIIDAPNMPFGYD
jgi:hypothetical protein